MEGVAPFVAALGLVLVLELGDKTQLAAISLAAQHPWPPVLAGIVLGLVGATAVGVGLGVLLAAVLTAHLTAVQVAGGLLFLAFGAYTYLRPETDEAAAATGRRGPFLEALGLAFVAEMGDKTQLAVIVLVATSAAPLSVLLGAASALAVVAAVGVFLGRALRRVLQGPWLRRVASALFFVAGALLLLDALILAG